MSNLSDSGDDHASLAGGFKHEWIIFHFIYGMSSFPLTNSYFSRWLKHPLKHVKTTNQIMKALV